MGDNLVLRRLLTVLVFNKKWYVLTQYIKSA